jgi:hypothetical protein
MASIKEVQAAEEAFSPQKRTSNSSIYPDYKSGSGYGSTDQIESGSNPDPDANPGPETLDETTTTSYNRITSVRTVNADHIPEKTGVLG